MIEINKISKRFGEFVCLSDVTLSIPDGSIYGLIGENGAGKSMLLRLPYAFRGGKEKDIFHAGCTVL